MVLMKAARSKARIFVHRFQNPERCVDSDTVVNFSPKFSAPTRSDIRIPFAHHEPYFWFAAQEDLEQKVFYF